MTQRLPSPGGDSGSWGDILNAYLEVSLNSDGTLANNVVGTNQIQGGAVTNAQLDSPTQTTLASVAGKYTLPGGGIPATDLTGAVQTELTAASTAVQSVNSKSGTSVTLAAADVSAVPTSQLGAASGVATLNGSSQLTTSQIPSSVVSAGGAGANSLPYANGSGGYTWGDGGINPQSGNYTFVIGDGADGIVLSTASVALAFTIPPHSSVAFAVPTTIVSEQHGSGALTVVPGAGVTLYFQGASVSLISATSRYGTIVVSQVATDVWVGVASGTTRRVVAVTQSATPAINTDITEVASITGLAQAITSMTTNLTGSPQAGNTLIIEITDNGTGRAITWGASFASTTIALPITTVASTLLQVGFRRDAGNTVWRCVGVA